VSTGTGGTCRFAAIKATHQAGTASIDSSSLSPVVFCTAYFVFANAFSALTRLVGERGRKGIRPVKKSEWWGTGVVICLE